jgi:nucleoside-diphosphate-sugar epimerase
MADVSLAKELLGFTPSVDIAEGIARTVDWFRERQPSS